MHPEQTPFLLLYLQQNLLSRTRQIDGSSDIFSPLTCSQSVKLPVPVLSSKSLNEACPLFASSLYTFWLYSFLSYRPNFLFNVFLSSTRGQKQWFHWLPISVMRMRPCKLWTFPESRASVFHVPFSLKNKNFKEATTKGTKNKFSAASSSCVKNNIAYSSKQSENFLSEETNLPQGSHLVRFTNTERSKLSRRFYHERKSRLAQQKISKNSYPIHSP